MYSDASGSIESVAERTQHAPGSGKASSTGRLGMKTGDGDLLEVPPKGLEAGRAPVPKPPALPGNAIAVALVEHHWENGSRALAKQNAVRAIEKLTNV